MSTDPYLVATGLSKRFGGVVALDDVAIVVGAGSCHGLVGANGAGKSTLMKVLAGQLEPDTGSIEIRGRAGSPPGPMRGRRRGIGFMPQELTLAPHLTIAENIMLGQEPTHRGLLSRRAARDAAKQTLESLGDLDYPLDQPVATLSAVDQRLVMMARALASSPDLLLLDEPTANMAPVDADGVLRAVRRIVETGTSVLYVSHRLDEIVEMCDRVTVMRDGGVVADLEPHDIDRRRLIELVSPTEASPAQSDSRDTQRPGRPARVRLSVRDVSGPGLHGVSFDVMEGETVGVVGLAGAGVENLLLALAGAAPRPGGVLLLDDDVVPAGDRVKASAMGIGYLPGDRSRGAVGRMTVRANVTLPVIRRFARAGVLRRAPERAAVRAVLASVALTGDAEKAMKTLSGGNQQKALVARWVTSEARVLVLADPTAGVDVHARDEIHSRLLEVQRLRGVSIVISSTDHAELALLCDRVIGLDRGRTCGEIVHPAISPAAILAMLTSRNVGASDASTPGEVTVP